MRANDDVVDSNVAMTTSPPPAAAKCEHSERWTVYPTTVGPVTEEYREGAIRLFVNKALWPNH